MTLPDFITRMPKVELHVHMEGSIRPETLLKLANHHNVPLPAQDAAGLQRWYTFTDFDHFLDIYHIFARCLKTPEDIELIAREFLAGQAEQHIHYSEATYTAYSQFKASGMPFEEQLDALNRARTWAAAELDTHMGLTLDISRDTSPEEGETLAGWAVSGMGRGVTSLGIGGPEVGNPPSKFARAFDVAREAGLPVVPHAGEVGGAESMWDAIRTTNPVRIGHGVRCLEDPALVEYLRERHIPLEVCPTSNVCLKVVPDLASHPLPKLMQAGLVVTLNSDDPPMFNTTLTEEYLKCAAAFGWDKDTVIGLVMTALEVSLLPEPRKSALRTRMEAEFANLA